MKIPTEVLFYLYKECLLSKKSGQEILNLIYHTIKEKVTIRGKQSEFLFFLSRDRKDFIEHFTTIYNCCDEDKCMLQAEIRNNWNLRNIFRTIAVSCSYFAGRKILKENRDYKRITLSEWFWISLTYVRYEMFREEFINFDFSNSKFLITYGEWLPEVAAILYANEAGLMTVVNAQSIYSLAGKGKYSDYAKAMLVWGDKDKRLISEMRPGKKLYVCGNPQICEMKLSEDSSTVGIALGAHENLEYNQKMIDIAEQYAQKKQMKIFLRLHPGDDIKNYRINHSITKEFRNLDSAAFILVHWTSMFAIYLRQGKKVFAYKSPDKLKNMPVDERFLFHDTESLEDVIRENESYDTVGYGRQFLECVGEDAARLYRERFYRFHMDFGCMGGVVSEIKGGKGK